MFVKFVFRPYSEDPWELGNLTTVANKPTGFNILKNGKIIDTAKSAREVSFKYNLNRHMLNTYFAKHKAYNHKDLIIYKQDIAWYTEMYIITILNDWEVLKLIHYTYLGNEIWVCFVKDDEMILSGQYDDNNIVSTITIWYITCIMYNQQRST